MADTSIFNVEPPRWLQNSTSVDWFITGQATGEVLSNIATSIGVESSKQFQDKEQGVNFFNKMVDASRVANDPLYLEKVDTFKAQAELTQATKKDQLQGMKEYAEWMKDTGGKGDWNGTSTYGAELAQKTALQNWMESNQQAAIKVKQIQADNTVEKNRQNEEQKKADLEERKRHNQATESGKGDKSNAFLQNEKAYELEISAVDATDDPDEKQIHLDNAARYKSWLEKQGKFAPPKIPPNKTEKIKYDEGGKPIVRKTEFGESNKKPTRQQAKDYVTKYGNKAKDQLKKDGFDLSGYAD